MPDCDDNSDETGCGSITPSSSETHDTLTSNVAGILNYKLYTQVNWAEQPPDWFDALSISEYEDLRDLYDFTLMERGTVTATGNTTSTSLEP